VTLAAGRDELVGPTADQRLAIVSEDRTDRRIDVLNVSAAIYTIYDVAGVLDQRAKCRRVHSRVFTGGQSTLLGSAISAKD
jgi:hypothetical protein